MPVEAIFFNVGQGDCTLLWFYDRGVDPATGKGTHAILIDCGSSGAVAPMTPPTGAKGNASALMVAHLKAKLANYLERLDNPRTLDALIITHPDKDHFNLLHKVLLDATGKLAYTIKALYYTLDPMEYREGGGTFMKDLLTDPDTLTSPAGHKVEERPIAMDPQTEPLPLLSRDTSRANLLMLGGSWYGDGVIHGRKGPKRKRVEYTKEEIANQSSLVTVLQGERDSGGKRQRVLLMGDAVDITEMLLMGFDKKKDWMGRQSNLWLKMGHHGSATSTCDEWIEHTTPDGLFVSTGMLQFSGASTTFTEANIRGRVLPTWKRVRGANGIADPVVTARSRIYGYQPTADPKQIWAVSTTQGVFSNFCEPGMAFPQPAELDKPLLAGNRDAWRGADWHLRLDHPTDGTYSIHAE
ncbi:MBL fold metallo-hydrolase [Nocardia sp. NBC_00881]|uniref:MBL fold metallo-hydrolase n=1 Tax=Nocardia sp. NBC_00881 TaxID=2975995 RepID=UPI003863BE10|nr:MBL fold metallo-hydrolase [Nocardia sp. NBC_00881]